MTAAEIAAALKWDLAKSRALVEAAPELLEAGEAALRSMREMHRAAQGGEPVVLDRGAFDALESVIAKARGEK